MYIESFHETWIDPEIAQSQLDFFIHQEGDLDFTGFENFIVNNINSTELVTPLIMSLVGVSTNKPVFINRIFLCENPVVNTLLDLYVISGNHDLALEIIEEMIKINGKTSSELVKVCGRELTEQDVETLNGHSSIIEYLRLSKKK